MSLCHNPLFCILSLSLFLILPLSLSLLSLQQAFNIDYNINIYSAHDYSILSVLGSLGILPALKEATQFGCFLIFELWDGTPPDHTAGIQKSVRSTPCSPMRDRFANKRSKSANNFLNEKSDYENRVLRILANFRPFRTLETDPSIELGAKIDESKEIVLAEFNMDEVREKHNALFECLISKGMYSPPYAKNSKI